jgi:hypothetical protein
MAARRNLKKPLNSNTAASWQNLFHFTSVVSVVSVAISFENLQIFPLDFSTPFLAWK